MKEPLLCQLRSTREPPSTAATLLARGNTGLSCSYCQQAHARSYPSPKPEGKPCRRLEDVLCAYAEGTLSGSAVARPGVLSVVAGTMLASARVWQNKSLALPDSPGLSTPLRPLPRPTRLDLPRLHPNQNRHPIAHPSMPPHPHFRRKHLNNPHHCGLALIALYSSRQPEHLHSILMCHRSRDKFE